MQPEIVIKYNLNTNYAVMETETENFTDKVGYNMLMSQKIPFLAECQVKSINNRILISYNIKNYISLEYLSNTLTGEEFIARLNALCAPFFQCRDWLLDYHALCLDPKHIFWDKSSNTFKFIYNFCKGGHNGDEDIKQLLIGVIKAVKLVDNTIQYEKILLAVLEPGFSLAEFSQLIRQSGKRAERGRMIAEAVSSQQEEKVIISPMTENRKKDLLPEQSIEAYVDIKSKNVTGKIDIDKPSVVPSRKSDEERLLDNLFGKNKEEGRKEIPEKPIKSPVKKTFLEWIKGTPESSKPKCRNMQPEKNIGKTSDIAWLEENPETEYDSITVMKEDSLYTGNPYFSLESSKEKGLPENISLEFSKGYFVIGRKSSKQAVKKADFEFESRFTAISRRQIRIEKSGSQYYIIDLDSTYKTYVNGAEIRANIPVPLNDNSKVAFAQRTIVYSFHTS